MFYYKIYGLNISSDFRFDEALELNADEIKNIDVTIREETLPAEVIGETKEETQKGDVNVYYVEKNRAWFRWYGQAAFMVTDGNQIKYQCLSGCDRMCVSELILCLALFYILYQREIVAIHGSGLVWNGKTIIISGESGSGKSSLAEAILKQGAKFLADDTVAIDLRKEGIYAVPAYPQQKLCTDQITDEMRKAYDMVVLPEDGGVVKYGVRMPDRFCKEPQKLNALVIIQKKEDIAEPQIREITGSDKMKYITKNLYKYETYVRVGLDVEVFKKCIAVANSTRIYLLSRPSLGMTVEQQVELLKEVL